jgi:hypothetical protein
MDRFMTATAQANAATTKQALAAAAQQQQVVLQKTSSLSSDKSSGGTPSSESNSIFGRRTNNHVNQSPHHGRMGKPNMPAVNVQRSHQALYMGKNDKSSSSSHDIVSGGTSPPGFGSYNNTNQLQNPQLGHHHGQHHHGLSAKMGVMQISDLKSEKFSAPNSIIKDRFFNSSGHNVTGYGYQQPRNALYNGSNRLANYDRELEAAQQSQQQQQAQVVPAAALNGAMNRNSMHNHFTNQYNHHPAHHQQNYLSPPLNVVQPQPTADTKAMQALQQIQEAKPGNKRAILTDLPEYLYSIPALASFFEPYGEVAMLQILPLKRMWDGDLIDLLGASMCNRLAQNTYCAIVEFYSARMAKFIIGILRKRLPILKFRCALLKPSAAIELTNQADNLGLTGAIRLRHIPDQKSKNPSTDNASSSGQGSSAGMHENDTTCLETSSSSSSSPVEGAKPAGVVAATVAQPVVAEARPLGSSEESGLDEMASSGSPGRNHTGNNSTHLPTSSSCSVSDESEEAAEAAEGQLVNGQRYVASVSIQLNR